MARLTVHSGRDNFLILERITAITSDGIQARFRFRQDPLYLGIEALAQLGAMHVRHITRLEMHAFLLKTQDLILPAGPLLNGTYQLSGSLISQSQKAYAYRLQAETDQSANSAFGGTCLFATADYGPRFKKEILKAHYQKVFSCLQNVSEPV